MPSPFPGMDPYLEDPEIWSGVHASFLAAILEQLSPLLRPKYVVRFEERVYVTSEEDPGYGTIVPDLQISELNVAARPARSSASLVIAEPMKVELVDPEIRETYLVVRTPRDREIVTVIELLSPTNKVLNSFGRESFLKKRREVMSGTANWLEIDLLRGGVRTANFPRGSDADYQVYLSRAGKRRIAEIWQIGLRERLPIVAVALKADDADVPLDLQAALNLTIERGSYDLDTDYSRDPVPPLEKEQMAWARELIDNSRHQSGHDTFR